MIRGVPYDHRLEYIRNVDNSYIDTGVYLNLATMSMGATFRPTGNITSNTWSITFGSRASKYYAINYNNYIARSVFDYVSGGYIAGGECTPSSFTTVECVVDASSHTVTGIVDGVVVGTKAAGTGTCTSTAWIYHTSDAPRNFRTDVARFWIKEGDTYIRDMFPVQVGSTGAFYDNVTKKLFYFKNGGCILGPVASTPLMGVHMYPQVYTAADYVQDGLLAGWSGIAQGGIPNVWKDFSGHKYDLTINPNTSHFESNYLNVGSISTAGAYMEGVLIPGVKHMEICCYVSQKTTNALLFYNGVVPSNMILASHSTAGVLTSNTKRHTAYKRTTGYYALSATHDILYADGTKVVDTTFSSDSWYGGSNSLCLFGRLNDTLYGTAGRIYSARAYSRELTPEEVAHNYEIDKLTFDLPDPE